MKRSLSAIIIHLYLRSHRMSVRSAHKSLTDTEDKMHYDIPKKIEFPRPVTKRTIEKMEVFDSKADPDSKLTLLYIHGGWCILLSVFTISLEVFS